MITNDTVRWRKSSVSGGQNNACVEVAEGLGAIRDSKNPTGPVIHGDVRGLLGTVMSGHLG
ncbi:MAG TPA: DUF397 domain-containing protein [Actinophytocola sp.]|jgi:hypothetical protein|uniref:DUF397 domain-containing protein n=1 Tax=Actinophytocola sp. TaxID=1872138 RepID=UPI002DFAD222|nr:DUF397 domain-containing protein [Actinophytocola sp.]